MSLKPPRLSAALILEICTRLRAGTFEQVAVESVGVPYALFQEWLRRGRQPRSRGLLRQLALAVMEAKAFARLSPETEIRKNDAKVWLLHGPGRDTPEQAGWGTAARPRTAGQADELAEFKAFVWELVAVVLEALTPYPEARQKVAEAIDQLEKQKPFARSSP